jgi:hypothetical protein
MKKHRSRAAALRLLGKTFCQGSQNLVRKVKGKCTLKVAQRGLMTPIGIIQRHYTTRTATCMSVKHVLLLHYLQRGEEKE